MSVAVELSGIDLGVDVLTDEWTITASHEANPTDLR